MVITILIILYFNNSFDFQKNEESRKEVLKYLKSPTTAIFCEDYEYEYDSLGSTHTIKSCVNSQNGFGAMIKTDWIVKLQRRKGVFGKSFDILNVNIGGITYLGEKSYDEKIKDIWDEHDKKINEIEMDHLKQRIQNLNYQLY